MVRKPHFETLLSSPSFSFELKELHRILEATERKKDLAVIPFDAFGLDYYYSLLRGMYPPTFSQGAAPILAPLRVLLFFELFQRQQAPIYMFAHDFAHELKRVRLDIPASHLPSDGRVVEIELPDDLGFDIQGTKVKTIYILGVDMHGAKDSTGPVYRRLEIHFAAQEIGLEAYKRCLMHFHSPDETIEEALQKVYERPGVELFPKEVIFYAINAFLYVHSGEPDLRQYRPPKRPTTNKAKVQRLYDRKMENQSTRAMTLVGFDFKKPKTFEIDSTTVRAHFQWYLTGPGRTVRKLVWKDPHVRRFDRDEADST